MKRPIATLLAAALLTMPHAASGQDSPFPKRIKLSEFPDGLPWLNTPRPLQLSELRGKFVLLDFWTYCCINCMHILPELKKLEDAYPRQLVVIGVHSPKFENERDAKNVAEAIARYEIRHPVVHDAGFQIWNRLGVRAWPTLMLVDPEGYAVWVARGEVTFAQLDAVLKPAVAFYRSRKLLDERPLPPPPAATAATPLRFPGKVLADAAGKRLFIADSNHNRIVVTTLEGKLIEVVGKGLIGRDDGDFDTATFNHPQGMALDGQTLYVADTENHLLRAVDLEKRRVRTIAGVGMQARGLPPPGAMPPALKTALASPWDLLVHGDELLVAMAGPHQIWRMKLAAGTIGVYAGSGREDIVDGALLPAKWYEAGAAAFAQPSGLASDGTSLFVADSEGSSIRRVLLPGQKGKPKVETLVGTASLPQARLFTFGDRDGPAAEARLQHPLGLVYVDGRLYVADTYNSKIKVIDPADGSVRTLAGKAASPEAAEFNEPGGLSAAAGRLYVADTNNHRIRIVELPDGRVETLAIDGLTPPRGGTAEGAKK